MAILRPVIEKYSILPGSSCQTTAIWPPSSVREGDQRVDLRVGYHVDGNAIQLTGDEREALIEDILVEYAEAWQKLAAL